MQTINLKSAPELKAIIRAAFPKYAKHNCFLSIATSVTLSGTYWDGGSRTTYVAVDLASRKSAGAPQYDPPQFGGPSTTPSCELPVGVAIVSGGTFCGKTATARIFLHPDNVAKLLPAVAQAREEIQHMLSDGPATR